MLKSYSQFISNEDITVNEGLFGNIFNKIRNLIGNKQIMNLLDQYAKAYKDVQNQLLVANFGQELFKNVNLLNNQKVDQVTAKGEQSIDNLKAQLKTIDDSLNVQSDSKGNNYVIDLKSKQPIKISDRQKVFLQAQKTVTKLDVLQDEQKILNTLKSNAKDDPEMLKRIEDTIKAQNEGQAKLQAMYKEQDAQVKKIMALTPVKDENSLKDTDLYIYIDSKNQYKIVQYNKGDEKILTILSKPLNTKQITNLLPKDKNNEGKPKTDDILLNPDKYFTDKLILKDDKEKIKINPGKFEDLTPYIGKVFLKFKEEAASKEEKKQEPVEGLAGEETKK